MASHAPNAVSGELCSSLEAAHSGKWLVGAPDNEAEDVEDEEDVQRKYTVNLLWVGVGISARPQGLRPFGSRSVVGELHYRTHRPHYQYTIVLTGHTTTIPQSMDFVVWRDKMPVG